MSRTDFASALTCTALVAGFAGFGGGLSLCERLNPPQKITFEEALWQQEQLQKRMVDKVAKGIMAERAHDAATPEKSR